MAVTGGCQCGAVRYEVTGEPGPLYVCHCLECRAQSGSAFGISLIMPAAGLRVLRGATRSWSRPTPSGRLVCHFCADCGSRLWHVSDPPSGEVTVKGGSLDTPPDLSRAVHIWTKRRMPGAIVPADAEQWPEEPEEPELG